MICYRFMCDTCVKGPWKVLTCFSTIVERLKYARARKGWFPLTLFFSVQMRVKFPCVNEIEAMFERQRVNVKVERGSTFTLRVTFDTLPPSPPWLPLFYLRAFIRKNYATVVIHLKTRYVNTRVWWFSRARVVSSTIPNWLIPWRASDAPVMKTSEGKSVYRRREVREHTWSNPDLD